jgi:polyamine oxidase
MVILKTENGGVYSLDHPTYKPFMGNQSLHVFFVTVQGQESYRIEAQSDEKTLAEMMIVLRKMYGPDIPDATEIHVPRWHTDPLFRGTYSNWPIGQVKEHFENVRAPLNTLFFTGEHTNQEYFGFVHGAMISGNETGNAIAECILGECPVYPFHPVLVNCDHHDQDEL